MTTILTILATKAGTYIVGAAVVIAAFVATYVKGRSAGKQAQKAKEADAYEKRLNEIADAANARPRRGVQSDPYNRDNG